MEEEAPQLEAPKFIVPAKDVETPIGKTVKITCKAKGVPMPELKWFKDDKEVIPDEEVTILTKDDGETTLTITDVQPEHDGTYTCQATNPAGSDKTKAELFVEGMC